MRKLYYMGLEPYKARYTLQLQDWNTAVFDQRGINYIVVPGETLSNDQAIVTGQVLGHKIKTEFSYDNMVLFLSAYLAKYVPKQVELKLPQLKKISL